MQTVKRIPDPDLSQAASASPLQPERRNLIPTRTLKGFRDLLPAQAELKGSMIQKLEDTFRTFGFPKIETPHLEYAQVLFGEEGADINKQIYRFRDSGDRDVGLRFDLTVPLARYVVENRQSIGLPFRRYAVGSVFRGEKAQAGRYREFTQCDFDIVGNESFDSSRSADAEIIQIMAASLESLGVKNFIIRVNNRKIFNELCDQLDIAEKRNEVLRCVDKLDKIGATGVIQEMVEANIEAKIGSRIVEFVNLSKGNAPEQTISSLKTFFADSKFAEGVRELSEINDILSAVGVLKGKYTFDLSIARGLGYYTGVVFETILTDLPQIGSVCSGGRYANLTSSFSKDRLPGVGASVGIDRLIAALQELGLVTATGTPASTLIFVESQGDIGSLHSLASTLRGEGIRTEVYPEVAKPGAQFKYAERHGHQFILRAHSDGTYAVKNLLTNQEIKSASSSEIPGFIQSASK